MNGSGSAGKPAVVMAVLMWLCASLAARASVAAEGVPSSSREVPPPTLISVAGNELQKAVDAAAPYSVLCCNRNSTLTLATPLTIRKPLTLQGLNARLPDGLGLTPLVVVESEGVTITDFVLTGNSATVDQKDRCALLVVRAGGFRIERGEFINSSKDGIMIDGPGVEGRDIVGGVVRDIVGRGCVRDVVSIGGGGIHGHRIRNLLVDNVRGYDSRLRGAVEVSDGTDNITVRKVFAARSVYAVDVQDHGQPLETNSNVVVEDIYAIDCTHAVRTQNRPHGHSGLTIRDITAERCLAPLKISNTNGVTLQNARILGQAEKKQPPVWINNCDGLTVRDVTVANPGNKDAAILIKDCGHVLIDGVNVKDESGMLESGICFQLAKKPRSGLIAHNVTATDAKTAGILLDPGNGTTTLTDVMITGNFAKVLNRIQGERTVINGNISF